MSAVIRCLLLSLVLFICCAELIVGFRMYKSRRQAIEMFGGSETDGLLNISSCEQNSNTESCRLAFDGDKSSEWSQCATTEPPTNEEDRSWWRGYLEDPMYVSSVLIHNTVWQGVGETDGLLHFSISGSGRVCYNHRAPTSFSTKTFACDTLAVDIEIRTNLAGAVLGLCEVQVFGVRLKFKNLFGGESIVPLDDCQQSGDDYSMYCEKALDRYWTSTNTKEGSCSMTLAPKGVKPWWTAFFTTPALVSSVVITGATDKGQLKNFEVLIGGRLCATHGGAVVTGSARFVCSHFGGDLTIRKTDEEQLILCHVTIEGFLVAVQTTSERREALGCFASDPTMPVLPDLKEPVSFTHMHLDKCDNICRKRKMKYFGVQGGMACWCGNNPPTSQSVNKSSANSQDNLCGIRCEGKSWEACGGSTHVSVFQLND